jgi:tRNA (cmo5U34)-methyltransferase
MSKRTMNRKADSIHQPAWDEDTSRLFIDYGKTFVPQRDHQIRMMVDLLSGLRMPCSVMELCCGEGLLAEMILARYPQMTVIALDGSTEMLKRTSNRLARFGERFRCQLFDLAASDWRSIDQPISAVVSSIAIHHLDADQKRTLFSDIYRLLIDGGNFIIADVVAFKNQMGLKLAADQWDEEVKKQALEYDRSLDAFETFLNQHWNMYRYFDPDDIDKPSPLFDQLKWLEKAGFNDIEVHWMLAGHALFSARKIKD